MHTCRRRWRVIDRSPRASGACCRCPPIGKNKDDHRFGLLGSNGPLALTGFVLDFLAGLDLFLSRLFVCCISLNTFLYEAGWPEEAFELFLASLLTSVNRGVCMLSIINEL